MFSGKIGIFLDRDGTIIEDRGYLSDPEGVCLRPGVKEVLKQFKAKQCLLFLVTNQSGINRGFFTMKEVLACHQRMLDLLGGDENFFTQICIATGRPEDNDPYRKPSPKFVLECLEKYHLNPDKCWIIGDRQTDVQTGINAHIHSIFLSETEQNTEATACCKSFYEVLDIVERYNVLPKFDKKD